VRRRYDFGVVGSVVMPEHVHLLLSEPARANPSVVMHALNLIVFLREPKAEQDNAIYDFRWDIEDQTRLCGFPRLHMYQQ